MTQTSTSLFIYNNQFCLSWKSIGNSFNQAIEESKLNIKVVDNVISDKHVKSFVKYENDPEKVQSRLTNLYVHDLEIYYKDRAIPYCSCI